MNDKQAKEMLQYLSRIAHAVESMAKKADPQFTPDNSWRVAELLENPATKK
jgi:hypothetical protein